jgi:phosphoglycerol transferase MdoB-like AlkP superfamily enzyme
VLAHLDPTKLSLIGLSLNCLLGIYKSPNQEKKKKKKTRKKILAAQIKKNKTWVERIYQRALVSFLSCQLCPLPAKLVIHLFVKSKKRKRRRIKRKLFVSFSFYTFIVKHVLISLYSICVIFILHLHSENTF